MKQYNKTVLLIFLITTTILTVSCSSCNSNKTSSQKTIATESTYVQRSPNFNSDSAYTFVKQQVDFGPRVPNSSAHIKCGDFLVQKLKEFDAEVLEQNVTLQTYSGINLNARNIIASYNKENNKRVLLFAHWDSRPFADQETETAKQMQPILGANDGASGVGVLLEIARQLKDSPINIGVDIILFDAEDWGQPAFEQKQVEGEWYCLGSQYWASNPHVPNYRADYGILLDMVGAPNATFYKEGYSLQYASNITERVWRTASRLGYGRYFINKRGGYITDDHVPVNKSHRAPSVNIIHTSENTRHGFGEFWHTHKDNMDIINKNTLKIVGQTVLEMIYTE